MKGIILLNSTLLTRNAAAYSIVWWKNLCAGFSGGRYQHQFGPWSRGQPTLYVPSNRRVPRLSALHWTWPKIYGIHRRYHIPRMRSEYILVSVLPQSVSDCETPTFNLCLVSGTGLHRVVIPFASSLFPICLQTIIYLSHSALKWTQSWNHIKLMRPTILFPLFLDFFQEVAVISSTNLFRLMTTSMSQQIWRWHAVLVAFSWLRWGFHLEFETLFRQSVLLQSHPRAFLCCSTLRRI